MKQYYKLSDKSIEYLGERYFAFDPQEDKVVQICVSTGTHYRKGKANTIGVILIMKITFLSNYYAMKERLVEITQTEYFAKLGAINTILYNKSK